jgi:acetylornithine/succinyldiaminopimelate/putrescine aminotransferase
MKIPYFLPFTKQLDIDIEKGEGVYLFDKAGEKYLDFFSGMGVNALGHKHPKVQNAIKKQIERNLHLFAYFPQDVHYDLSRKLVDNSHFSRVFFTNSGTESIEGALKLLKKWGNQHGKNEIVCFNGGFHGRTLGALSVTAQKSKQEPFYPLLDGIISIDKTISELEKSVNEKTTAVMLELITGEGGIYPTSQKFIDKLVKLRQKFGFKILVDDIQAGIGRTGKLFSFEHFGFDPDLLVVAKAIGGGLPLGAILIPENLRNVFVAGEHGTTFGGNPLACATGNAVIDELLSGLLEKVEENGKYLKEKLHELKEKYSVIEEIRGMGLMIGIHVGKIAPQLMNECLNNKMIVNATQGNTIRFLPPLIVEKKEIDEALFIFEKSLKRVINLKLQ